MQWPGVWPGAGTIVSASLTANSPSVVSTRPAATTGLMRRRTFSAIGLSSEALPVQ